MTEPEPIPSSLTITKHGERRALFPAAIGYALELAINQVFAKARADLLPAVPPSHSATPTTGRAYLRLVYEYPNGESPPEAQGDAFGPAFSAAGLMAEAETLALEYRPPARTWKNLQVVPVGCDASKCRHCETMIFWIVTDSGAKMPVDCDAGDGTYRPKDGFGAVAGTPGRGVPHFATCKNWPARGQRARRKY